MKLTITCGIILGLFQLTAPVIDSSKINTDSSGTASDTLIQAQLKIMSEQKQEPLTLNDTVRAVAGRYAFTIERGQRDLRKHNEAAEELIQELDSIIQKNQ